jgi:predicted Fe-Mo cluster-binding NifX family protein
MFSDEVSRLRKPDEGQKVHGRRGMRRVQGDSSSSSRGERVCITSTGHRGQDPVDPRFGRCAYFLIVDGPQGDFRAVENQARVLGNGAGIQAAQTIVNLDVKVLITGDLGPNAFRVLSASGIRTFRSLGGTAEQVLSEYRSGKLSMIEAPTGPGHHGRRGFGQGWGSGPPEGR